MALATRARETVRVQFREVGNSGVLIALTKANQENSMRLLRENGLRRLTYQEALVEIGKNPELKEQLKGKWFYLDGKGSQVSGCHTFNVKGELTPGNGGMEETVYVYEGTRQLVMHVYTDRDANCVGRRCVIFADNNPSTVAEVVVGVRIGREVTRPKIEVAQTKEGVKLTGITLEQLVALRRDSAQELSKVIAAFGSESLPKTRMLVAALRVKE